MFSSGDEEGGGDLPSPTRGSVSPDAAGTPASVFSTPMTAPFTAGGTSSSTLNSSSGGGGGGGVNTSKPVVPLEESTEVGSVSVAANLSAGTPGPSSSSPSAVDTFGGGVGVGGGSAGLLGNHGAVATSTPAPSSHVIIKGGGGESNLSTPAAAIKSKVRHLKFRAQRRHLPCLRLWRAERRRHRFTS